MNVVWSLPMGQYLRLQLEPEKEKTFLDCNKVMSTRQEKRSEHALWMMDGFAIIITCSKNSKNAKFGVGWVFARLPNTYIDVNINNSP